MSNPWEVKSKNKSGKLIILGLLAPMVLAMGYFAFESYTTFRCHSLSGSEAIAACHDTLKNTWLRSGKVTELKKRLGTLQVNAGLYQEAIPYLDDVINAKAGTYYDYYNRGIAYSWLNDYKNAVVDYEVAYALRPDSLDSLQDLAIGLMEIKEHAKAQTLLQQHIEKTPDVSALHRLLAEAYYNQGNLSEALASAKKAVEKNADDADAHNTHALMLEFSGDFESALDAYTNAIRLAPDNIRYLRNRAILHRDMENYELSKKEFLKLLGKDRNVQHLSGLALVYLEMMKPEEALPLIKEAEALNYKDPQTSYVRGRHFLAIGKNDAARDTFTFTLKNDPGYNIAKYWHAVSLYNLGETEHALKIYASLEPVWPNNGAIRVDQADALYDLGRYQEAMLKAEEGVKLNPKSNLAFATRGRIYGALEKWDSAIVDATTSISLFAENAQVYYDRAYAYWQLAKYAEAQNDYDKAHNLAPQRLTIAVERAEFMFFDNKVEEARTIIEKLNGEGKSSAQLTRMLGRLADHDGKFVEALKLYQRAQRENPNLLWVSEDIAYAQIANDQPALALLTCEEMLQKLPMAPASHRCFARAHIRMSKYEDALVALDKALAMDPKFWAAHLDRAYTLLDMQNYEASVEVFNKLVKEKYRLATVYYNRGYAHERLKQNPLAIKDYEAALAIADPGLAKSISTALNSLRAKQPTLRRLEEAPSPQSTFRR